MLVVTPHISIPLSDIDMQPIRAQGPGGQNVNKVSSAIHLRFDIKASALTPYQQARIMACRDKRISDSGVIIIKAQNHRTQARNKSEALDRLAALLESALKVQKNRRPTRPSYGAVRRRLKKKAERSQIKALRGKPRDLD